jgi:hypothetical protein
MSGGGKRPPRGLAGGKKGIFWTSADVCSLEASWVTAIISVATVFAVGVQKEVEVTSE